MVLSTVSMHQAILSLQTAQYDAQPLGSHAKQSVFTTAALPMVLCYVNSMHMTNAGCCKKKPVVCMTTKLNSDRVLHSETCIPETHLQVFE